MKANTKKWFLNGLVKGVLVFGILTGFSGSEEAQILRWSSTNIQWLYGTNYKFESEGSHNILTFEHSSSWRYGDNFLFIDIFDMGTSMKCYGEWHSRLSFSKMTNKAWSWGIIKDILLAGEINLSKEFQAYLVGIGFDFKLPHFAFFQLNVYLREERGVKSITYQVAPAWSLPFSLGRAKFDFCGFIKFIGKEDTSEANVLAQPQLLLDVGNFFGKPNKIFAGIEYQYWHNKYGIDGEDEKVVQGMVKWVL